MQVLDAFLLFLVWLFRLKMRRKFVAQVTRSAQTAVGAGLTQRGHRFDQQVNLLLLPYDDFIELVNQVFRIAGFDFQFNHALF